MFSNSNTHEEVEHEFDQWKAGEVKVDVFEMINDFISSRLYQPGDPWAEALLRDMKTYI